MFTRNQLARVQYVIGVEGLFDSLRQVEPALAKLALQILHFSDSDAVFTRKRSSESQSGLEDLIDRLFHPRHFIRVVLVGQDGGMQVAVAGVSEGAERQAVLTGNSSAGNQH